MHGSILNDLQTEYSLRVSHSSLYIHTNCGKLLIHKLDKAVYKAVWDSQPSQEAQVEQHGVSVHYKWPHCISMTVMA